MKRVSDAAANSSSIRMKKSGGRNMSTINVAEENPYNLNE
jgi:hypothetical protein